MTKRVRRRPVRSRPRRADADWRAIHVQIDELNSQVKVSAKLKDQLDECVLPPLPLPPAPADLAAPQAQARVRPAAEVRVGQQEAQQEARGERRPAPAAQDDGGGERAARRPQRGDGGRPQARGVAAHARRLVQVAGRRSRGSGPSQGEGALRCALALLVRRPDMRRADMRLSCPRPSLQTCASRSSRPSPCCSRPRRSSRRNGTRSS